MKFLCDENHTLIGNTGGTQIRRVPHMYVVHGNVLYSATKPNNSILYQNKPHSITAVDGCRIRVQPPVEWRNFFDKPFPSSDIGIFKCYNISQSTTWTELSQIQCKGFNSTI